MIYHHHCPSFSQVDLGFGSAKVLPSSAGVPLLSAFSDANCGTKAVLQAVTGWLGGWMTSAFCEHHMR